MNKNRKIKFILPIIFGPITTITTTLLSVSCSESKKPQNRDVVMLRGKSIINSNAKHNKNLHNFSFSDTCKVSGPNGMGYIYIPKKMIQLYQITLPENLKQHNLKNGDSIKINWLFNGKKYSKTIVINSLFYLNDIMRSNHWQYIYESIKDDKIYSLWKYFKIQPVKNTNKKIFKVICAKKSILKYNIKRGDFFYVKLEEIKNYVSILKIDKFSSDHNESMTPSVWHTNKLNSKMFIGFSAKFHLPKGSEYRIHKIINLIPFNIRGSVNEIDAILKVIYTSNFTHIHHKEIMQIFRHTNWTKFWNKNNNWFSDMTEFVGSTIEKAMELPGLFIACIEVALIGIFGKDLDLDFIKEGIIYLLNEFTNNIFKIPNDHFYKFTNNDKKFIDFYKKIASELFWKLTKQKILKYITKINWSAINTNDFKNFKKSFKTYFKQNEFLELKLKTTELKLLYKILAKYKNSTKLGDFVVDFSKEGKIEKLIKKNVTKEFNFLLSYENIAKIYQILFHKIYDSISSFLTKNKELKALTKEFKRKTPVIQGFGNSSLSERIDIKFKAHSYSIFGKKGTLSFMPKDVRVMTIGDLEYLRPMKGIE